MKQSHHVNVAPERMCTQTTHAALLLTQHAVLCQQYINTPTSEDINTRTYLMKRQYTGSPDGVQNNRFLALTSNKVLVFSMEPCGQARLINMCITYEEMATAIFGKKHTQETP